MNRNAVTFIDTEVHPRSGRILDIGGIKADGTSFHSSDISAFVRFLQGTNYVCGHNILRHDLKYICDTLSAAGIHPSNCIDTLYLSPLLFPTKPYHALLKDDKLQTDDVNNPLSDSIKAKRLLDEECSAFGSLGKILKQIYGSLLKDKDEFSTFFNFIGYQEVDNKLEDTIREKFHSLICENTDLSTIICDYPVELAYCLALINTKDRYSITPPWVLKNYPNTERIMFQLRNNPCLEGCSYCNEALNIQKGLKQFFGYDSYREYDGVPLQQRAAQAAIEAKSLLAVFPTGGGKSITFQVPALMAGLYSRGLTIVISPLQSLMKDQVDNLEKIGITEAVTINGLLDPIERAKSIERVENGSASILYISPESLRSKTIERLLLGRQVVRFVIDEAHCFSSWGQDFRTDYLYIGEFIKSLQMKKNLDEKIPVSCFTATAKPKVIEDIKNYFKDKLGLEMETFIAGISRDNLRYKVHKKESEDEKYQTLRDLIGERDCPTIIYVSRTRIAEKLANRLTEDGYDACPYHGQMEKSEKSINQDAFINGEVKIIVATSAFGMGVDKKDVGMIIHYDIPDSLENYVQEAGRAGRDQNITADCLVLFNETDLDKHFILLNQTKLSIKEIGQIWKAIKDITRFRSTVSLSALEIARKAGWDEGIDEIESRVKTAIAALEDSGYLKRNQNMPRVFANSILAKNAQEAIEKIDVSNKYDEVVKENAKRIIKHLISSKSRKNTRDGGAESRVDYIAEVLGIEKRQVIEAIYLLREENILADNKDLTVYVKKAAGKNTSLNILETFSRIERYLLKVLPAEEIQINIKSINESAEQNGCDNVSPNKIKLILNYWAINNWIKRHNLQHHKDHFIVFRLFRKTELETKITQREELANFIVEYLFNKSIDTNTAKDPQGNLAVEFSILELKENFENRPVLFKSSVTNKDVEDALFFLTKIEALTIDGGFFVVYNGLGIERLEHDNKRRYKVEDYKKLEQFYANRIQQIHIIGEYATRMLDDYKSALQFVDDYFKLIYSSFLNKYFPSYRQEEISRNITPAKFQQLFGSLSPRQLKIIKDNESRYIVVAAGPGSGKTRILVHKLASLLLTEDVKPEQLLMVTFSRAAATEFKKRLLKLIHNAAHYVEIKTFHSYCFDLLGKVGTIEKSKGIIQETIKRIKAGEVEQSKITKTVLVIDEAQDMDSNEYELVNTLIDFNEEMRVIAVGDDDQNIYEFRGASSKFLGKLINERGANVYELTDNYRSKRNLVDFTNHVVERIPNRLKRTPVTATTRENGKIITVRYRSRELITPLVNDVLAEDIVGSTCILTTTNSEASLVTGLLERQGFPAKLIQSNDDFNLYDLFEVRFFMNLINKCESNSVISDDEWEHAKRELQQRFCTSLNLKTCLHMIRDFESTNCKHKYKTDLEIFFRESKFEDFFDEDTETILVSTIHKAKGREFDNVFLLLNQVDFRPDEAKRQLYVGMTRAKHRLSIHYNGDFLNFIHTDGLEVINDFGDYPPPSQIVMQLNHRDVLLDFFPSATRQRIISQFTSGDRLVVAGDQCCNIQGQPVLKFSKQALRIMRGWNQIGYSPISAKVRFVVYWKREKLEYECLIVLPEICFERNNQQNC